MASSENHDPPISEVRDNSDDDAMQLEPSIALPSSSGLPNTATSEALGSRASLKPEDCLVPPEPNAPEGQQQATPLALQPTTPREIFGIDAHLNALVNTVHDDRPDNHNGSPVPANEHIVVESDLTNRDQNGRDGSGGIEVSARNPAERHWLHIRRLFAHGRLPNSPADRRAIASSSAVCPNPAISDVSKGAAGTDGERPGALNTPPVSRRALSNPGLQPTPELVPQIVVSLDNTNRPVNPGASGQAVSHKNMSSAPSLPTPRTFEGSLELALSVSANRPTRRSERGSRRQGPQTPASRSSTPLLFCTGSFELTVSMPANETTDTNEQARGTYRFQIPSSQIPYGPAANHSNIVWEPAPNQTLPPAGNNDVSFSISPLRLVVIALVIGYMVGVYR